jgi:hypothetical protein
MPKFVISVFSLLVTASCFAQQSKLSPEQEQVWSMEEKYWQILKASDRESYIALWDENFVGWPYQLSDPVRKDSIRVDPFRLLQGIELKSVQLEPKAVQVLKDVAIAYYMATVTYARKDGSIEVESFRFMHTWRKTNGVWLIIGGMSAPAQPTKQGANVSPEPHPTGPSAHPADVLDCVQFGTH